MKYKSMGLGIVFSFILFLSVPAKVLAGEFDPAFYAKTYPDVVSVLGYNPDALYQHYITYGMSEGRYPYSGAAQGEKVDGISKENSLESIQMEPTVFTPVPMDKLANYKSLKKRMTVAEFQQAYNVALQVVTPLAGLCKEEQLTGIAVTLRMICDSGLMYSISNEHYNDPYGYFILGTASCAGCARATGLCLNILGIPYEHVNENQWSHQWCRVNIDGVYWICDAFGLYCGPEPAPYVHPFLQ